jgi:peptide/nickel transport system substrate-binding protein
MFKKRFVKRSDHWYYKLILLQGSKEVSMKKWLHVLLIAALVTAVGVLPAFAGGEQEGEKKSDLLVGMDTGALVSLDPAAAYEVEGHWLLNNVYDTLVRFKPGSASEIEPGLATSWEVDGTTLSFTLREGVQFSNGDPVTAEAAEYSLKRVVKLAKSPSWILTQFGVTEDSIRSEGNQVFVEMDKAYSPQLVLSCMAYISGVVNPNVTEANAQDGDMGGSYLNEASAGSGPYILKEWTRNERVVLERNPNYWGEPGEIERIILIDIPESSSQLVQLKGGSIDIAWNLEYDQIPDVEDTEGLYTITSPLFKQIYFAMNASVEPLDNVKVRQALKSAINTEGLIKAIGGGVTPLHSFVPKGMFAHYDGDPFPYDPERARELLAEAGYPDGFSITLSVPDFLQTAGTVVKTNLTEVGVDVQMETIAYSTLLGKYRKQGLEMVIARWGADYGDPDAMAKPFGHCRTTGDDAKVKQLAWRNGYANPELTDMIEEAALIQDKDRREEMYIEIQKQWLEEGIFEILYQFSGQVGLSESVQNFKLSPLTETPLNMVTIGE